MTKAERFCDEMELAVSTRWSPNWADDPEYLHAVRPDNIDAVLRALRAAGAVIVADADHGLVLEPEMRDAMDNLAETLNDLPTEPDTGGDDG